MRIRITESQYRTLVNKPRDVVFGNIYEAGKPKETPEEIDAKIEEILNHVRNGGEFIRDNKDKNYKWLYYKSRSDKTEEQKFQKALDQIGEIREPLENKKIDDRIEGILNHVRNGGEFTFTSRNPDYIWLNSKIQYAKPEEKKFKKVLDKIKEIREPFENKKIDDKIKEILNHVRNGGKFISDATKDDNYNWLKNKLQLKPEKFKNTLDQIKKIQKKLDYKKIKEILNYVRNGGDFIRKTNNDKNYSWLYNKSRSDKTEEQKFQKALDQIYEIQKKSGKLREWWGEKVIRDTLIGLGFEDISQQGQHKYEDCKNSLTCNLYKFDIYLPYNENNYMVGKNEGFYIPETGIIFEYDGLQHFKLIEYFGSEGRFERQIHSDKEKNSYCQNHKPNPIKLVRIPYTSKTTTDIQNDIELALKNPSTFILTGNYPQLGWNQQ